MGDIEWSCLFTTSINSFYSQQISLSSQEYVRNLLMFSELVKVWETGDFLSRAFLILEIFASEHVHFHSKLETYWESDKKSAEILDNAARREYDLPEWGGRELCSFELSSFFQNDQWCNGICTREYDRKITWDRDWSCKWIGEKNERIERNGKWAGY